MCEEDYVIGHIVRCNSIGCYFNTESGPVHVKSGSRFKVSSPEGDSYWLIPKEPNNLNVPIIKVKKSEIQDFVVGRKC